jgi:hypothetical protein
MVEASGGRTPNGVFQRRFAQNFADRGKAATVIGRTGAPKGAGKLRSGPATQEFGTIEGPFPRGDERRSPVR